MAVFWVVEPCSLVEFTDVSEVLAHRPDDEDSKYLWNVGKLQTTWRYNAEDSNPHPILFLISYYQ
jgi:hypothetical protein